MFGVDPVVLLIVVLAAVSAAAVCYGVLYSQIEAQKKTDSRVSRVKAAESDRTKVKVARDRVQEMSKRRKSVQDTLKDLEKRQVENTKKKQSLKARLVQAGLSLTPARFYVFSVLFGLFVMVVAFLFGAPLAVIAGLPFAAAFGLPRWVVGFLIKRRQNKFLEEFPNALDLITRSIRSGLPLNDAVRLVASEAREPVKTEFRRVVETQQVGLSMTDACARMNNHMPLQEVNFFSIVIAIQAQAGGNLSEALGNLAKVLRERKKMKAKVVALSMEAKASAVIIGALPFIVMLLVYLTSPQYMMILFTDPRGHLIMLLAGIWMAFGVIIMRQMVNFDI
ncbi:type II secretion system F family protein [Rhizobium rhizogenes]|uniref:type II secretion system F family protein n=1 Tax=Rhizobium rhizogenes TaxID=359 RepID=UPI0015734251|nr:type II secretion system F family protein [Rhizobium rhizogenes]NTH10712.1 type II secretion system F family protein [Rhizobium rhizogenes]NTI20694.1 type II secretion system F family protein [Rhizobium rhizogenes]NTI73058.1 type II secretion system F family protein [Rhizobium rhizogenes]QRM39638.1 type II secretion system F family protein [Rhizobium rhizogenes]QTG04348.1 type II secretion system F family protein [Rhizobium rhizogenes]